MKMMHRIVNHLVLHSSFLKEVGLFHGRIGISIVLYHYARYIKDPLYEEFGGILLDDVLESIPNDINIKINIEIILELLNFIII